MAAPYVEYRFAGRRKAESFILYPPKDDGRIMFQSDKSIGIVDLETKTGKLYLGTRVAYGVHLMHAPDLEFPDDFIELVKAVLPKPGEVISLGGGMVHVNY